MNNKYESIINLPHHVSKNHPRMSIYDRSAQFAPFAALTGYDESINEAGKSMTKKIELGIDKQDEISQKLIYLSTHIEEGIEAKIIFFDAGKKKKEGKYITKIGKVIKIDVNDHYMYLNNKNEKIYLNDIIDIEL